MEEKSRYEDIVADSIKDEMVAVYIKYMEEYPDASYEEAADFIIAVVEKYCEDQPKDIQDLIAMWSTGFFAGAMYAKYYKGVKTIVT